MEIQRGIKDNLTFLAVEVGKQLQKTESLLASESLAGGQGVVQKDDYVDNLKTFIQRKCFAQAAVIKPGDDAAVGLLKAIDVIAVNLERISDFCENIISQTKFIEEPELVDEFDFKPLFKEVRTGVKLVTEALFDRDTQQALRICRTEHVLDRLYAQAFRRILRKLEKGTHVQTLVTLLFIFRYLERAGDSLLNIGEAILSALLGERIKIDQFRALEDSLETADLEQALSEVALESVKETKSGARISRVRRGEDSDPGRLVIFKDGRMEKLLDERRSIETWNRLMPGLVPQIYSFNHRGDYGSILFEYIEGVNFDDLLVGGNASEIADALKAIMNTLLEIWTRSREETPSAPRFLAQMTKRVQEVYALHPEFRGKRQNIGSVVAYPLDELVERARPLDDKLVCPFSVYIHGDFNVDNIIFDDDAKAVHFIDLHRSAMSDYVQDVSVFLVSNHRLQVLERPIRRLIHQTMVHFFNFAKTYAQENEDKTFDVRLALGLARSYATSTRFVLDKGFARSMFHRAQYLLESVLAADSLEDFELMEDVLHD